MFPKEKRMVWWVSGTTKQKSTNELHRHRDRTCPLYCEFEKDDVDSIQAWYVYVLQSVVDVDVAVVVVVFYARWKIWKRVFATRYRDVTSPASVSESFHRHGTVLLQCARGTNYKLQTTHQVIIIIIIIIISCSLAWSLIGYCTTTPVTYHM